MSNVLELYEQQQGLSPMSAEVISARIDLAETCLANPKVADPRLHTERVIVWLHDRLQAVYDALENPTMPAEARCAWCLRAAGSTDEAWRALPKMSIDDSAAHAQVCEHNPLVQRTIVLQAEIDELKRLLVDQRPWTKFVAKDAGVPVGVSADAIRALLKTELPAEKLRQALAELVR